MIPVSLHRSNSQNSLGVQVEQGAEGSQITEIAIGTIQGSAPCSQIPPLNLSDRVSKLIGEKEYVPPLFPRDSSLDLPVEGNIEPDRSSSGWVDDDERDFLDTHRLIYRWKAI